MQKTPDYGCRIGKVTMKEGGAVIYLLPPLERTEAEERIVLAASSVADYLGEELVGYVVVGWAADGHYSNGYYINNEKSPVGLGMMPSFVADVLRRRMIEAGEWAAYSECD